MVGRHEIIPFSSSHVSQVVLCFPNILNHDMPCKPVLLTR